MRGAAGWAASAERGSALALRFAVWFYQTLGRRLTYVVLLYPIATYFFLTDREVRRASRAYLARIFERVGPRPGLATPPRWWHPFRHVFAFAEATLDRFCFWARRYEGFEVRFQGREHLMEHVEAGRGAILLGAHLGSFDVLRVLAEAHHIVVNVVMFTDNAQRINSVFKRLDPESDLRVISIDPYSVRSAFEVKRCLDRGEFVAILGDRVGLGGRDRVSWIDFLGKPAPFPLGPFLLSQVLGAPVLFTVALRIAPATYQIVAEPFCEAKKVPRREREKALQESVGRFVACLEKYCEQEPFQWFNFYDFWEDRASA